MIKIVVLIIWVLIFTKLMLFWLWLWQLKEYHWGRLKAHFETQKIRKLIASLTRFKCPKFTKKIIALLFYGLLLEIAVLSRLYLTPDPFFYVLAFFIFISAPLIFSLIVLLFQIPTDAFQKRLLKKAKRKREKFKDLIVVGITGSYGKTSTKEFLATILEQKFKVLKTAKHINAEIGIAQTILKELEPEHQIFIAEIGAYEQGKIRQVCQMLQPKIGILTGINEQHMSTFGSQENIVRAKYELIESLPQNGLAIFNGNNKYCRGLYQKTNLLKKITIPTTNRFSAIAENLLPWHTENVLMAVIAAEALGMTSEEIADASKKIKSPIQIRKGINGTNIIDSTHSANSKSVLSHLEYLNTFVGKKVIIMPCLIELGKAAKEVHQRIGERIARVCDLAIITTKDYFLEIKKAAIDAGLPSQNILLIENPKQILEKIKTLCQKDDTILLESRVPQSLISTLLKSECLR